MHFMVATLRINSRSSWRVWAPGVVTPLVAVVLVTACAHQQKPTALELAEQEARERPPLIDAQRLPDAAVQVVLSGTAPIELPPNMAQLRETLCEGETAPVIFHQLVVAREWHYYWLCSEDHAVRAMTKRGDTLLRRWLRHVEQRASREIRSCPPTGAQRLFAERHDSGTVVTAYCDGTVVLDFPDGGRKSFQVTDAAGAAPPTPAKPPGPSSPANPPDQMPAPCPPCPQCAKPNTLDACKTFGERAFSQGVRKACDTICPALFKKCHKQSSDSALCRDLSEFCATLPGVCVR